MIYIVMTVFFANPANQSLFFIFCAQFIPWASQAQMKVPKYTLKFATLSTFNMFCIKQVGNFKRESGKFDLLVVDKS